MQAKGCDDGLFLLRLLGRSAQPPGPHSGPSSLTLVMSSGALEAMELAHRSGGQSRDAKRSPGEGPAAPDPPAGLQRAPSFQPGRWGLRFHCGAPQACRWWPHGPQPGLQAPAVPTLRVLSAWEGPILFL